jgi:hypothetical protein
MGPVAVLTDGNQIDATDPKWPCEQFDFRHSTARSKKLREARLLTRLSRARRSTQLAPILGRRSVNTAGRVETIRHFDRRFKTADRRVSMIEPNARREWAWLQGEGAAAPAFC